MSRICRGIYVHGRLCFLSGDFSVRFAALIRIIDETRSNVGIQAKNVDAMYSRLMVYCPLRTRCGKPGICF